MQHVPSGWWVWWRHLGHARRWYRSSWSFVGLPCWAARSAWWWGRWAAPPASWSSPWARSRTPPPGVRTRCSPLLSTRSVCRTEQPVTESAVWSFWFMYGLITTRQRNCRKVMFSVVSICLFRGADVPVQGPAPQTCWKLFILDLTVQGSPPPPDTFKFVHYEAWTARKRAVDIQLKCLLVNDMILFCDSYCECDCDMPKYIDSILNHKIKPPPGHQDGWRYVLVWPIL